MCYLKQKKVFADMQTKDNFIKTIEIMKEDSLYPLIDSNNNELFKKKGLLTVNMEIVDCDENCDLYPSMQDYNSAEEYRKAIKKLHNYKLVFDGYQRIKVSELKNMFDTCYKTMWFNDNLNWLYENEEYIKEYLEDEEYCIVYFINKEETFKANGWELK